MTGVVVVGFFISSPTPFVKASFIGLASLVFMVLDLVISAKYNRIGVSTLIDQTYDQAKRRTIDGIKYGKLNAIQPFFTEPV